MATMRVATYRGRHRRLDDRWQVPGSCPTTASLPGGEMAHSLPAASPEPVAWLPVWLPNDGKGVGIRMMCWAPSGLKRATYR